MVRGGEFGEQCILIMHGRFRYTMYVICKVLFRRIIIIIIIILNFRH